MREDRVIVFARAPRLGAVKRRLARGIGAMGALRFYRGQLAAVLAALAGDRRWRTSLAATPDRARPRWPRRLPVAPQGAGDLGARMARAMRPHRRVVVVGSDIPGIGRADIAAAFRALGRADAVFGPAKDGGYWLVGLRRSPRLLTPFGKVRWSGPHALADTLRNLEGHRIAFAATLSDVDSGEDYRAARNNFERLIGAR